MPKMKVLETGQAPDEVATMSWSPKMDLLALGNRKGYVHLHRLSWQKVWQVQLSIRGETVIPELMAWHPEGLFLIVSSGCCTFVIDVECGKVVHSHELPVPISTMRWSTSQYRHSMNDVLSTQSKQQSDYLRNDLKIQRLETNLSILFLGTANGYVYTYTGGFLLGLCLLTCEQGSTCQVLQIDASPSLESFQFLTEEESGPDDMILSLSHFKNDYLPRIAPIIGPLGLKYILFLKNWAMIQSEISNLNEHWGRLVDLYNNYMTFGGVKDLEVARVDYLELLLTGITCVEMELFLGDGGREKEAKKNMNAINTANASITEHLRTIKCSIVNLLTELNEIGGFLKQISGYEDATTLMVELRKSCNYLFLAILHIQSLVHNFVEVCLHFMHMIMNTIHSFNAQEVPDFIEEDADTDKVLEFLETKVDKDIFQFLMKNVSLGSSDSEIDDEDKASKRIGPFGELNFPEKNALGSTPEDSETRDFLSFPELVRTLLDKFGESSGKHSVLMDLTDKGVNQFLCDIVPTINKLTKSLLGIPVLCSVPFEAEAHQIIKLPKNTYFDNFGKDETTPQPNPVLGRKPFQILMDSASSKTTLSCLWTTKKLLFFELDFHDQKTQIKSISLNFSPNICASKLFSENYVTIVSHEQLGKSPDACRSMLCQVQYRNLLSKAVAVDLNQLRSKCGTKSVLPTSVQVDVPMDIPKPCCIVNHTCIDYVLPLEGFTPFQLNVSGQRKVGALLAENRRTVLLMEMETDLSETSYDDTADLSDSEDGNSNNEYFDGED